MAEEQKGAVSSTVDSMVNKYNTLPASQEAGAEPQDVAQRAVGSDRLFGREKSVHELLGAGTCADVLLWRRPLLSFGILAAVTAVYIVFEWVGCHVLSVLSKGSLIVLAAIFVWSNVAALLKKSPERAPAPRVSEEKAIEFAQLFRDEVNLVLHMLHDVILGKDIKLFLEVEVALWFLAYIGKWADFLTTVYVGVFILLTVPALYERHEEKVDDTIKRGYKHTQEIHGRLHDKVATKMDQLGQQKAA